MLTLKVAVSIAVGIVNVLAVADYSLPKRLEYKYSFKPPRLSRQDGTIPFWEKFGDAIVGDQYIRLVPSLVSHKGSLWSVNQTTFDWWEVEMSFRISGIGRVGGDGLAFWYVEQKSPGLGKVFGGPDLWKGLGVFFDSFDNDNQHNNPYIMAMYNDGTRNYNIQSDGFEQKLGGCIKDYRNKPFPLKARIQYHNNILTVYFNNGMNKGESDAEFELCFRVDNLHLSKFGYFGLSASTSGLADDHDVQKFLTSSIKTAEFIPDEFTEQEQEKYNKEFQGYQESFDKQKQDYKKEHPDAESKNKEHEEYEESWLDQEYSKELLAIFDEQSAMKIYIQTLSKRLDEILGKHESITSAVNHYHQAVNTLKLPGNETIVTTTMSPVTAPMRKTDSVIQRYEVENLLASNKELLTLTNQIKELIRVLETTTGNVQPPPPEIPGIPSANYLQSLQNILGDVDFLKNEAKKLASVGTGENTSDCPAIGCISTKAYFSFSVITTGIIVGYLIYKDNYHTYNVKKFY